LMPGSGLGHKAFVLSGIGDSRINAVITMDSLVGIVLC